MDGEFPKKPFIFLAVLYFCFLAVIVGANTPFALMLFLSYISYILSYRVNLKGYGVLLFIAAFLVRFVYILAIKTPPESDFLTLFSAAIKYSKGDFSFSNDEYFTDWAYQTGFVVYQGFIIRIVGVENAELALKILNALFSSGICLLAYLISRNFVSEEASRFGSFLTIWSVFPITFCTVLSNQHISTFFIFLALYFLTDKKSQRLHAVTKSILAGFFLALGNIMRPEAIIIMGALFVFFVLGLFTSHQLDARKSAAIKLVSFLVIYLSINFLASKMIIDKGVNREGLRNNNPYWKFVVGLNFDSKGAYSERDADLIYENNLTSEERKQLEIYLIKQRMRQGPKTLISLFISKFQYLWGRDPMIWSYRHLLEEDYRVKLSMFEVPFDRVADLFFGIHNTQMFLLYF